MFAPDLQPFLPVDLPSRRRALVLLVTAALVTSAHAAEDLPLPPNANPSLVAVAKAEGRVRVYASVDVKLANFLIVDFEQLYPGIKVEFTTIDPAGLDSRFDKEIAQGGHSADVLWSAAMDRQMACVARGCALTYRSPESASLPAWARWQDQVYATTYEPIVVVYNRRLVRSDEVPTTHAALTTLLLQQPDRFQGKVATYDPQKTALGSLLLAVDAQRGPPFWRLAAAMGARDLDPQSSTETLFTRISSGQSLIAYDILGSDAVKRAKRDPIIGVQYTTDYNLVLSRLMLITRTAANPNAAKLWLDYVLSRRGQTQMGIADLYPIRPDIHREEPGLAMLRSLPGTSPIKATPALARLTDPSRRRAFDDRWTAAMGKTK